MIRINEKAVNAKTTKKSNQNNKRKFHQTAQFLFKHIFVIIFDL